MNRKVLIEFSFPIRLQGYLAHKKQPPPRTLQWEYLGSYGGPERGGGVLMSEVPLYSIGGLGLDAALKICARKSCVFLNGDFGYKFSRFTEMILSKMGRAATTLQPHIGLQWIGG